MAKTPGDANTLTAPSDRRRLPIGIQTFREIREGGYYYVDKTAALGRLVDGGKHYFLSRPRRFGKSLLVDTLKELFEGNRPLFSGLAADDRWDWSVRHPVLRLDFSGGNFTVPDGLSANVEDQLAGAERRAGVDARPDRLRCRGRMTRACRRHPMVGRKLGTSRARTVCSKA